MYRIRRFGVLKTATVVAVLYMVVVAIFAIPFALFALAAGAGTGSVADVHAVGVISIALLAIVAYGLLGWVFTAIACALYNIVAGWTGGIEVQVESVGPPQVAPVWGATPAAPSATPPPGSGAAPTS